MLTNTSADKLVITKDGRKHIVACAPPADPVSTQTRDLAHVHTAVVAASAHSGFSMSTPRSFTPEAEEYAATAPIKLVDGAKLIASIKRSKAEAVPPETYKARGR